MPYKTGLPIIGSPVLVCIRVLALLLCLGIVCDYCLLFSLQNLQYALVQYLFCLTYLDVDSILYP